MPQSGSGSVFLVIPPPPTQVTVYTIDTSSALLARLESLQARIIEENVRLIVLDSVAALARRVRFPRTRHRSSECGSVVSCLRY